MYFTLQLSLETCLYAYIKKKYYVCSLCGYVPTHLLIQVIVPILSSSISIHSRSQFKISTNLEFIRILSCIV